VLHSVSDHVANSVRDTGRPVAAVILAAGKGTRMNSDRPKVAHEVADRAMVWWVVQACHDAGIERVILVIGHGADEVRAVFVDDPRVEYVLQDEQLGTGHATNCAAPPLAGFDGDVVVLAGDGPLIRPSTLRTMLDRHRAARAAATLATSVIDDPTGYGRIVRDEHGRFDAIVEHRNATDAQRAIREIYPSYACFDARRLFAALARLRPDGVSGEYYVTDVPAMLKDAGETVELVDAVPPEDVLSINTPEQLAEVDAILSARMEARA
jgi:bifunctional UDP-N-acetylglucosamine pyrophosphorylase/glucosamine-1-phosphate N-acetyltransferase